MSRREMLRSCRSLRNVQTATMADTNHSHPPPKMQRSSTGNMKKKKMTKSMDDRLQRSRSVRGLLEEDTGGDVVQQLHLSKSKIDYDFDEEEPTPASNNQLMRMRKQSLKKATSRRNINTGEEDGAALRRGSSRRSLLKDTQDYEHSASTAATEDCSDNTMEEDHHTVSTSSSRQRRSSAGRRSSSRRNLLADAAAEMDNQSKRRSSKSKSSPGGPRRKSSGGTSRRSSKKDTTIPSVSDATSIMDQSVASTTSDRMHNDASIVSQSQRMSLSRRREGMKRQQSSSRRSMSLSEPHLDGGSRSRTSLSRRTEGMRKQQSRRSLSSGTNRRKQLTSPYDDDGEDFSFPANFDHVVKAPMKDVSAPAALQSSCTNSRMRRSQSEKHHEQLTSAQIKRNLSEKYNAEKKKHIGELKIKPVAPVTTEFANWEAFQQNGASLNVSPKKTNSPKQQQNNSPREGLTKGKSLRNMSAGIPSLGLMKQKSYRGLGE